MTRREVEEISPREMEFKRKVMEICRDDYPQILDMSEDETIIVLRALSEIIGVIMSNVLIRANAQYPAAMQGVVTNINESAHKTEELFMKKLNESLDIDDMSFFNTECPNESSIH